MESSPDFFAVVSDVDGRAVPALKRVDRALRKAPAAIKVVKRDSKAPRLDVVAIDFMARRIESARISAGRATRSARQIAYDARICREYSAKHHVWIFWMTVKRHRP